MTGSTSEPLFCQGTLRLYLYKLHLFWATIKTAPLIHTLRHLFPIIAIAVKYAFDVVIMT